MRPLIAALVLGLMLAPAAQAKLNPTFSGRIADPGDTVELDLGEGSEQFLGPLRIYLVPLEVADRIHREDDPRLAKIGELGTRGEFGTPRTLRFEVPDLPTGDYTAAIWFKGYATGLSANALQGIHPLLTIGPAHERAASPAASDALGWTRFWAVALAVSALGTGLVAWGWRRATRRQAAGGSAS